MENILTVKNLKVQFKTRTGAFSKKTVKTVLNDVSFDIRDGEIIGLVGESGSGKSTIAKAVLGLVPYEGEIKHYSDNPQMIFQDPYSALNPSKRVGWLLEEALYLKGEKDSLIRSQKALEMIELVGLSKEYLDRLPSELSGGQRQRVCIGLSLMQNPKFLIADEAVSALDVTIQAQILDLLKKLHERMGISILFISHDLKVVYNLCNRVMILKQGQIVEMGEIREVYSNPQHEYTKQLLASVFE